MLYDIYPEENEALSVPSPVSSPILPASSSSSTDSVIDVMSIDPPASSIPFYTVLTTPSISSSTAVNNPSPPHESDIETIYDSESTTSFDYDNCLNERRRLRDESREREWARQRERETERNGIIVLDRQIAYREISDASGNSWNQYLDQRRRLIEQARQREQNHLLELERERDRMIAMENELDAYERDREGRERVRERERDRPAQRSRPENYDVAGPSCQNDAPQNDIHPEVQLEVQPDVMDEGNDVVDLVSDSEFSFDEDDDDDEFDGPSRGEERVPICNPCGQPLSNRDFRALDCGPCFHASCISRFYYRWKRQCTFCNRLISKKKSLRKLYFSH